MNPPREIWTYIIVTLVTVLIWFWAAAETRETKIIYSATVRFNVPDGTDWIITPQDRAVVINLTGAKLGIRNAETLARTGLTIEVRPVEGPQTVDLAQALAQNESLRDAGVTINTVEPSLADITLDRLEQFAAPVKAVLPGITLQDEAVIDPPEVQVTMPKTLRQRGPRDVVVEAFVDRSELDRLLPGAPQSIEARLRLPEGLPGAGATGVSINPNRAKLTFTVRSRTREIKLDTVRVQIAGPPEDRDAYVVEIDPKQLRGVTISAASDLARRIETNEVPVVAVVHLSALEKENRIASKPVSYFLALVPDGKGGTAGEIVKGTVAGSTQMPAINLKITDRQAP
jgi:hypothetical protein